MSLYRLIKHDLKQGILRWRYFCIVLLFAIPCISLYIASLKLETEITWLDYMMYYFAGIEPIANTHTMREFRLPYFWILVLSCSLFVNLDYLLGDLSKTGHQIIYRCKSRKLWYISKCIWNTVSSILFVSIGMLTAYLFTLIFNGIPALHNTPKITQYIFDNSHELTISSFNAIGCSIISPLLTIISINILQMSLCLYCKPIYSFIICVAILTVSVYNSSPLLIGNGAMVIRNKLINGSGSSTTEIIICSLIHILLSVLLGFLGINRYDIIVLEE